MADSQAADHEAEEHNPHGTMVMMVIFILIVIGIWVWTFATLLERA